MIAITIMIGKKPLLWLEIAGVLLMKPWSWRSVEVNPKHADQQVRGAVYAQWDKQDVSDRFAGKNNRG